MKKECILFFDDECAVCNYFVIWFLKNENLTGQQEVKFASLNSDLAKKLIPSAIQKLDTVVFYKDGNFFIYSDVLLCLLPYLKYHWKWLGLIKLIPKSLRDFVYRLFAKYRKKISGQTDVCLVYQNHKVKGRILT